jgi:hypothetical protein
MFKEISFHGKRSKHMHALAVTPICKGNFLSTSKP